MEPDGVAVIGYSRLEPQGTNLETEGTQELSREAIIGTMAENREEYENRAESEFNRLAEQLGRFMARVETRARKEYKFVNSELKDKREKTREHLTALKGASSEAWKDLRPAFESAWKELKDAFSKARSRFAEEAPETE